tara:strand:- start:197 stop:1150 length:954 start_codon:yes stop_codon:yes gene_type:complete
MSIDYSILEDFNINKELVIPYIENSAQIKKYVEGICNTELIKSTRNRQAKGLKEMIRNLKEWYCSCCDIQFYKQTSYNKHILGIEHRAKSNNKKIIVCSNSKCRTKCIGIEGLDIHLENSPDCANIPNNKRVNHFENIMKRVNREKEISNRYHHYREQMTNEDIIDWNCMIRREHGWNPKMIIIKDADLLIRAVVKEKFTEEDKQKYNDSIRKDYEGRTDVEFIEDTDGLIQGKVKTIFDELVKEDKERTLEENEAVEKYEEMHRESAQYRKDYAMEIYNMRIEESTLESDKFLGGYSSEGYSDDGFKDLETEIKEI